MGDTISRQAVLNTLDDMDKTLDDDRTVENYKELLKECYEVLPSITPQQRWIPVNEDSPKINGKYLVTIKGLIGGYIYVGMYAKDLYKIDEFDFIDKQGVAGWYNYDGECGYYEVDDVIAWKPLPEPYKSESE